VAPGGAELYTAKFEGLYDTPSQIFPNFPKPFSVSCFFRKQKEYEIGETWETSKLSPIWEQRETTPPGVATAKGNVSDDSQAQPRYNVSLVSDKSADKGERVIKDQTETKSPVRHHAD